MQTPRITTLVALLALATGALAGGPAAAPSVFPPPRPVPVVPENASCLAPQPWGYGPPQPSGTLVCFKGDPRAPYLVLTPQAVDGTPGGATILLDGTVWRVTMRGPMGEPMFLFTLPAADCVQLVNLQCTY